MREAMNCPVKTQENTDWLLDYVAGRTDRERSASIERHLEVCVDCTNFVARQRAVWNALGQWEPEPVGADFDRRLYRRIEESRPVLWIDRLIRPLQPSFWRPAVPFAAACAVIAAGLLLHSPQAPVAPGNQPARLERAEADQVERTLDDMLMLRELMAAPAAEEPNSKSM
jgi:anti-sigma factor RsiW